MSTHNPYAWLTALVEQEAQRLLDNNVPKPRLTLVTPDQTTFNTKEPKMNKSPEFEAAKDELTDLLNQSLREAKARCSWPNALHEHGAFNDISAALDFLSMGADALKGIGAMMQPEAEVHDEQLNQARRSDLSAIFKFFGEALREPAKTAYNATERLMQDVESMEQGAA